MKNLRAVVCHGRYAIFQMDKAALPWPMVAGILTLINCLRGLPAVTLSA